MMRDFTFKIKRFNPENRQLSSFMEFHMELAPESSVLDALMQIKGSSDGTLTFRSSCAHGICGSCAMEINGENRLACQTLLQSVTNHVTVKPLPAFPVIKDLVVDMNHFFSSNDMVMPYLINNEDVPKGERLQSMEEAEKISEAITCIMCGSCTSTCYSYRNDLSYVGPSALLKAYRFMYDSRDRASKERVEAITKRDGVWKCRTMLSCNKVCPKNIDITGHIAELKREVIKNGLSFFV